MPSRNPNPYLARLRAKPTQVVSRFQPGASLHLERKATVKTKIELARTPGNDPDAPLA